MATEKNEAMPPLEPGDERPAQDAEAFVDECLSTIHSVSATKSMTIGKSTVTHNPQWGDTWRADFDIDSDSSGPLVNRITCWRQDGTVTVMFAIGQDVPPL